MKGSSPALRKELLCLAISSDYNLAERAINAVDTSDLQDATFQRQWVNQIQKINSALQKPAILKMREAHQLDPEVAVILADKLSALRGELIGTTLDVLNEHAAYDLEICRRVSDLLANPNFFISRQAYDFLVEASVQDNIVRKRMESFREEHGLN